MKFQQLRYLVAVHENGLNITAAARQLHTSQPGVSRQLKLLEEELGFQLFEREGRALTRTTAAGEEIISRAASILRELGYHILEASFRLEIPRMFAALLLLALAGIIINFGLGALGRMLLRRQGVA